MCLEVKQGQSTTWTLGLSPISLITQDSVHGFTQNNSENLLVMTESTNSRRLFLLIVLSIFLALPLQFAFGSEIRLAQRFSIGDYFKIQRVAELSLSSDGQMIAFAVDSQSLDENKTLRNTYITGTAPGESPTLIEELRDARNLAWTPGSHDLAFLSDRGGSTQIYSYQARSKKVRQHTHSENSVWHFLFASDGKSLAYVVRKLPVASKSLYDLFQTGDQGVLIDSNTTSVYEFINTRGSGQTVRPSEKLWVALKGKPPFQAEIPGNVKNFHWSSDAKKLSVTYIAENMPDTIGSYRRTSIGIYDSYKRRFHLLGAAIFPSGEQAGNMYAGGEWIRGANKIFVRRSIEKDLWVSPNYPAWTLVDLSTSKKIVEEDQIWHEIEIYGMDAEPAFIPTNDTSIYTNKTVWGVRSLYQLTASGALVRADIARSLTGSISQIQFSADFEQAVFVNESLTRPPEIYLWRKGQGVKQLTHVNDALSERLMPTAREMTWKSKDGAIIHGWLLEPAIVDQVRGPWPLVTFVHGGPGYAMSDEFADYFQIWPYPFMSYALNGMAVFMPNYRGTKTYGKHFATPGKVDGEPVDDIISGIERLVKEGIADPKRLGISGQSHGAWLAPLVMTRAKIFSAGSFSEGTANKIVNYTSMPGELNRKVHDVINGSSLYDSPERYVELSPDLHFKGLKAAVLFEAGNRSLAVNMLGLPNAARAAHMPAEYIVYPKTSHNIAIPRLQKESAERNLDWFRFWLKGEEDSDPAKIIQYRRWRDMRQRQVESS